MKMIKLISGSILMGTSMFSSAQTTSKNPFTLVYENAITENVPGKVNIHQVTYKLNGIDIAANVYTPANYDSLKSILR